MTTIVNTPPVQNESSGNMGMVIGFIGILVLGFLFFVFGLPALRNARIATPQVNIPTEVVIPEDINVNITN